MDDNIDGNSFNPRENLKNRLKQDFPEVFTEDSIVDFEKLKATLGEDIEFQREKYGLSWSGKSDCFREIQKTTTATLVPEKEKSVNFDETENIFIEGENLEVLRVLQKSYYGKVKMIYIDPPYNTGNDFIYDDSFKRDKKGYQKDIGEKDEEGNLTKDSAYRKNTKDNGHYHSDWLNMMYPRLFLARNLLRKDGVIFVSIDDNEVHNLRLVMNEVFGEENFVASLIWEKKYSPQNDAKGFSENHDYILVYSKDRTLWFPNLLPRTAEQDSRYKNWDEDPRGPWKPSDLSVKRVTAKDIYEIQTPSGRAVLPPKGRSWSISKIRFKELIEDNRIWFGKDGDAKPQLKRFLSEVQDGIVPMTILPYSEVGHNQIGAQELKQLFEDKSFFDSPKPLSLLKRLVYLASNSSEGLFLDFFAGSGTLGHAVMSLNKEDEGNRKYILVQLPEKVEEEHVAYKEGFETIADISRERLRRAGSKLGEDTESLDTGFKSFKLDKTSFKQWNTDISNERELKLQLEDYVENGVTSTPLTQVYELLLKSGYDLNSEVVPLEIKDMTVYSVNSGELVICLKGKLTQNSLEEILESGPAKVIILESCFSNDDELKTNTLLQLESQKVDVKVI